MKINKKHLLLSLVGILCAVFVLSMVLYNTNATKKVYHIIYIPKIIDESNDFWTSLIAGAKMAAQEYEMNIEVYAGENEEDVDGQNALIEKAIEEKPDAILVSPCSYTGSNDVLKKVQENGIKLVYVDSTTSEESQDLIIATNNYAAGEKLGSYAKELVSADDEIAIIGHVKGASTAIDREEGVRAGLDEYADNIVDVVFCGSEFGKSYSLAVELVQKYPNLKMIIGLNEYSAVGAARAIRDLKMQDRIKMVGFDSSVEEVKLMEAGVFQGIVIQKPFNMGYLGVEQTYKLLSGKNVNKNLDSGSKLITMDNLYDEENQKLLFPFVGKQE